MRSLKVKSSKCDPATMPDFIQQETRQILDTLAFTPFEQCQPLSREFDTIPVRVGLYAFRHSWEGLLYIGKAKNLRDRLRGGHKAFLWGWLDRYDPGDVRIAFVSLKHWQKPGLLSELETLILQATNPPTMSKSPENYDSNLHPPTPILKSDRAACR